MSKVLEPYLSAVAREVEERMRMYIPFTASYAQGLGDAMAYTLLAGGKKLRPFYAWVQGTIFSLPKQLLIQIGAVIEVIHTYSLIHDDLPAMDDALYRRGKPSCHQEFGEATAILTGDALQALAFHMITDIECISDAQKIAFVRYLSSYCGAGAQGLVTGQMGDMWGENNSLTEADVLKIYEQKTAAPFLFIAEAIASIGLEEQRERLRKFARYVGLIFQIRDDVLDYESSREDLGKPIHADEKKVTLVKCIGYTQAMDYMKTYVNECENILSEWCGDTQMAYQFIRFLYERTH